MPPKSDFIVMAVSVEGLLCSAMKFIWARGKTGEQSKYTIGELMTSVKIFIRSLKSHVQRWFYMPLPILIFFLTNIWKRGGI